MIKNYRFIVLIIIGVSIVNISQSTPTISGNAGEWKNALRGEIDLLKEGKIITHSIEDLEQAIKNIRGQFPNDPELDKILEEYKKETAKRYLVEIAQGKIKNSEHARYTQWAKSMLADELGEWKTKIRQNIEGLRTAALMTEPIDAVELFVTTMRAKFPNDQELSNLLEEYKQETAKRYLVEIAYNQIKSTEQPRYNQWAEKVLGAQAQGIKDHIASEVKKYENDLNAAFQVLNIPTTASEDEVRAAYKKLSLKLHPDKPTGSNEAFQTLGDAYAKIMKLKFGKDL